jgi:hypothetical protein
MKFKAGAAAGVIACAIMANAAPTAIGAQVPTYKVLDGTLDKAPMAKLAKLLNLKSTKIGGDNVLNVLSTSYLDLPTKVLGKTNDADEGENPIIAKAFDLQGISKIKEVPRAQVEKGFKQALQAAGALPPGSDIASDYTHFGMGGTDGTPYFDVKIDTHVWDNLSLSGKPLVGPGAQIEASVDPKGTISSFTYAARELKKSGMATLTSAQDAIDGLKTLFNTTCSGQPAGDLDLTSTLVYYSPDMNVAAKKIFPHYEISGTLTNGDQKMDIRKVLVPAVDSAPQVNLTASADGANVTANAQITGGTGPYTTTWSSCDGLDGTQLKPNATTASYDAVTREGGPAHEVISLVVTDANGLVARKSVALDLSDTNSPQSQTRGVKARAASTSQNDVGAEFIGQSGGLPGSAGSVNGWNNAWAASGIPREFSWGDGNAWETDFTKFNSTDDSVVDNVDDVFYTGHANNNGWTIGSGDGFVDYNETFYGNKDIEWLHIAACGPLQGVKNGDLSRWFNTMR